MKVLISLLCSTFDEDDFFDEEELPFEDECLCDDEKILRETYDDLDLEE